MPAPSYTYTLTNSTTADASQVMQNFNDILNGISDGSKDLSINALTCASTATFNGNVVVGNSSSDDFTVTASLASSLVPKTTNVYNLGSADLGYASLYLGTGDTDTARIVSAALTADRTYTVPDAGADASFAMTAGTQTISGTKTFDGQLIGKGTATNDSAATGYIGEVVSAAGSTTGAVTTATNLHSTSFQPGDWDVSGFCNWSASSSDATTRKILSVGISTTSATLSGSYNMVTIYGGLNFTGFRQQTVPTRISLAATSTVYLVGDNLYVSGTTGTMVAATPTIYARRVR